MLSMVSTHFNDASFETPKGVASDQKSAFEHSLQNSQLKSRSSNSSSDGDPYMTSSNWTEKFKAVIGSRKAPTNTKEKNKKALTLFRNYPEGNH